MSFVRERPGSAGFDTFCQFLKDYSGQVIGADKSYLIESKMQPIIQREGLDGLRGLMEAIRRGGNDRLTREVVETMTINETYFFRDKQPFEILRDVLLPELHRKRPRLQPIRIWCAAASTGQEPYSIAMIAQEMRAALPGRRVEIVGSDLSENVLQKARDARYSQFEIQRGLPTPMLLKYFVKGLDGWQLKPEIRESVRFLRQNLMDSPAHLGRFDIVFCRNVMIYFDQNGKRKVLDNLHKTLAEDGYLMLGASESILGITEKFTSHPEHRVWTPR